MPAAGSSRVVKLDGDQTKPAQADVNRRKMINEPRIRVIHPILLGEPTSFAPCRWFVLSHHRCCRQASSFRCRMQLSCLCSRQGLRAETHRHRHRLPTTRCSERRNAVKRASLLILSIREVKSVDQIYINCGGFSIRNGKFDLDQQRGETKRYLLV